MVTKRNSYTISFSGQGGDNSGRYGHVLCFLKCFLTCKNPCKSSKFVAIIFEFKPAVDVTLAKDQHTYAQAKHVLPFMRGKGLTVTTEVDKIISLCIEVSTGSDTTFVCKFPNTFEKG